VRQRLLDAIYSGRSFRTVLSELGLTSNQVWGLTKTDQDWSERLEAALTATRRDDLEHGTNAAYVQGCMCSECRTHHSTVWPGAAGNCQWARADLLASTVARTIRTPVHPWDWAVPAAHVGLVHTAAVPAGRLSKGASREACHVGGRQQGDHPRVR
jgi:hypothetical protein